ncbi:MAG: PAS domain-containing protein [Acidobacteriota bacterium]|nr:PAS domain-containing protein [Acidobacteriota bacterium]
MKSPVFRKFLWSAAIPGVVVLIFLNILFWHSGLHAWLVAGLIAAIVIAFVTASSFANPFLRRLMRMQAFAEDLPGSQTPAPASLLEDGDELGSLARSLLRARAKWQEVLDQLKLESQRREVILKSMVEGVLAVDNDSRVIFCNDSFARLVNANLPLPPRLTLLDLARDPSLTDMLSQVLATHEPLRQTLQLSAAFGRVFEVQAAPLAGPAHGGALAILHDITDLERLKRVREDFVANVSHELRTPLTAIRGYAEALLDGGLEDTEQNRKFVEVILNHAIRLNNIASDLLVLSELESNREQPGEGFVSVQAAVDSAIRAVEEEANEREVSLIRGPVVDAEVKGSRVRLEQALINLLTNAVKFNRPGGSARIETAMPGEESIAITISDNGAGIPSEDLSRIFERFYRVDKARSREVGGTGLGLSIVKHVVERIGGSVKVESQLGKGSAFTVTLPIKRS